MVTAVLTEEGTIEGSFSMNLSGYRGVEVRRRVRDQERATAEQRAREAAEDATGSDNLNVLHVVITNADDVDEPVNLEARFELTEPLEIIGDHIYLTPMLIDRIKENPFQAEQRTYPVEFAYPYVRTYGAEIAIPEGLVVESLPEDVLLQAPGAGYATYGPSPLQTAFCVCRCA
ncbi:hypothetical protein BH23BAC4_BH23BAC4_01570 [soil metagenome]